MARGIVRLALISLILCIAIAVGAPDRPTSARAQTGDVSVQIPGDADGDGVADRKDRCAATPLGAVVNRHGCPLDSDQDGVFDGLDRCPSTPANEHASVDAFGCALSQIETSAEGVAPIPEAGDALTGSPVENPVSSDTLPAGDAIFVADTVEPPEAGTATASSDAAPDPTTTDSDRDGVPDARDLCPNTPHPLQVDKRGCLIMTQLQRRLILHVSYMPGTTKPDRTSLRVLDDLIVRLKRTPEVTALVEGFTDNIGIDGDNLRVSQKRADRIKAYLIKNGIPDRRIKAVGRGETRFIASNDNRKGRQKNRRIEISFHREPADDPPGSVVGTDE